MHQLKGFKPEYISVEAIQRAHSLIQEYDLHHDPDSPVDVTPLLSGFDLRFMDLPDNTYGFTLETNHHLIIALNDKLEGPLLRSVAMHELGHIAMWHPNELHTCLEGEWIHDQLETEASTVAALLLLPRASIEGRLHNLRDAKAIAGQYDVPLELVLVRQAILTSVNY